MRKTTWLAAAFAALMACEGNGNSPNDGSPPDDAASGDGGVMPAAMFATGGTVTGMVESLFENADRWKKRPCSELEGSAEVRQSLIIPELC